LRRRRRKRSNKLKIIQVRINKKKSNMMLKMIRSSMKFIKRRTRLKMRLRLKMKSRLKMRLRLKMKSRLKMRKKNRKTAKTPPSNQMSKKAKRTDEKYGAFYIKT